LVIVERVRLGEEATEVDGIAKALRRAYSALIFHSLTHS